MNNKNFWAKKIVGFIVCAVAIAALLTWVVMSLWNCVLVAVLGVSVITFWQAAGILLLSKILFGGFRKGWGGSNHKWGHDMKEKWQHLTPEEKEKFKEQWRNKCSAWGRFTQPSDNKQAGAE